MQTEVSVKSVSSIIDADVLYIWFYCDLP